MRSVADVIWCGASSPVIQGLFVGLGVSAVGLVVFPFFFSPVRPRDGVQSNYRRAVSYVKWAKTAARALGACAAVTLAGYVILYTDASGRFCTEHFDHEMQLGVYVWTGVVAITFALAALTAVLRGLSRNLGAPKR